MGDFEAVFRAVGVGVGYGVGRRAMSGNFGVAKVVGAGGGGGRWRVDAGRTYVWWGKIEDNFGNIKTLLLNLRSKFPFTESLKLNL